MPLLEGWPLLQELNIEGADVEEQDAGLVSLKSALSAAGKDGVLICDDDDDDDEYSNDDE